MKTFYERPEIELVRFRAVDVIRTSNESDGEEPASNPDAPGDFT